VSGFTPETPDFPEIPGLPRILWVIKPQRLYSGWGGIKATSTPSFTSLPCHFRAEQLQTSFTPPLSPFGSKLVRFVVGFKRIWEQGLGEC
jgi:hypothetical protein